MWTIDVDSPAYPRIARAGLVHQRPQSFPDGPGAELKKLLGGWPLYITSTSECPCNAYSAKMNAWGCDECAQRLDEIVAHLREQAEARGLPFIDVAGRLLVKRAIRNARQKHT